MKILGISAFGQNPSAALLSEGKMFAFAEEERFLRIKSADGFFPTKAIEYCLKESGCSLKDIDQIAVGWDHEKYSMQMPMFALKSKMFGRVEKQDGLGGVIELLSRSPKHTRKKIQLELQQLDYKASDIPVVFYSHHLSHAASTFYCSGYKESLIVVMDGSGEERATTVYVGSGKKITKVAHFNLPHSLGWYYAAFSTYLGFKAYEEDGFLMGLASYGSYNEKIQRKVDTLLQFNSGNYWVDSQISHFGKHTFNSVFGDKLVQLFGKPRHSEDPVTAYHKNLAFAVQFRLEQAISHLVHFYANKYGQTNLCLAGGVALNVKANGVLLKERKFRNVFIQPVSHDAGVALGAAQLALVNKNKNPFIDFNSVYFGPSYSNDQVKSLLDTLGVKYKKIDSVGEKAADLILKDSLVGWFRGRMEVGPRALGHRSILANPTNTAIKDTINRRVKYRDEWRPFCPSMTTKAAKNLFSDSNMPGKEARFMGVAYDISAEMAELIPSVIHVDSTTRPQVIDRGADSEYTTIIEQIGKKTGHEVVLNTSLNIKGEPMVCSPLDAIKCFYGTGLDHLIVENYLLSK